MRILQVVTLIGPDGAYGGPARVALNQSRELSERGHHVTIAAASGYGTAPTELNNMPVRLFNSHRLLPGTGFAGLAAPGLQRWLYRRRNDFDVLHVHLGRDLVTLPTAVLARRYGLPYAVQTHGMVAPSDKVLAKPLDTALTVPVLGAAAALFHLTERERADLVAVAGPDLALEQLDNGVPAYAQRVETDDEPEVLFAARLHERKRPTAFVDIARTLLAERIAARFTLIGPDEGEAGAVRRAIGGVPGIEWIGPVEPSALPQRMTAASIYVLPAVAEPFPMSVLEAMAVGLPVVVTKECGLAKVIESTGSGIVTESDVRTMTDAVRTLLQARDVRIRMGEQARATALTRFGMRAVGDRLTRTYERIVEPST